MGAILPRTRLGRSLASRLIGRIEIGRPFDDWTSEFLRILLLLVGSPLIGCHEWCICWRRCGLFGLRCINGGSGW